MSPALAGRLSTPAPPGKPFYFDFKLHFLIINDVKYLHVLIFHLYIFDEVSINVLPLKKNRLVVSYILF